jgi:hypothetical protein
MRLRHLIDARTIGALILATFSLSTRANTEGMDIEKYCKDVYGPQSHALLLNSKDGNSWRCSKGTQNIAFDFNDVCHRQHGSEFGAALGNKNDPNTWSCVPPSDRRITGAVTPQRVNADLEADAIKLRSSGKSAAFGRRYYFFSNLTPAEFTALAKNIVFLVVVQASKAEELPIKRIYLNANGKEIQIPRIAGSRMQLDGKSVASQVYGSNREDGIYLVPAGAMLRDGQILMDFAASRNGNLMMQLPSNVVVENAKRMPIYNSPDAVPGAKPTLRELQEFIRRKLPGFPVPNSLP